MPIYEYECEACGGVHEILQKISEKPLVECPKCSGKLHKRISQCSFHLKGTGWYVTDYANGSKSTSTSKSTSSKSDASETATPAAVKSSDSNTGTAGAD